jgi:hypothetical protein
MAAGAVGPQVVRADLVVGLGRVAERAVVGVVALALGHEAEDSVDMGSGVPLDPVPQARQALH